MNNRFPHFSLHNGSLADKLRQDKIRRKQQKRHAYTLLGLVSLTVLLAIAPILAIYL